jgi:hypothetical protein
MKKLINEISVIQSLMYYDTSKTIYEQKNTDVWFKNVKQTYPDKCWGSLRIGPYNYQNQISKSTSQNDVMNVVAKSIFQGVNDLMYQSSNWGSDSRFISNSNLGSGGPGSSNSLINVCKSIDDRGFCKPGTNKKFTFSKIAAENPTKLEPLLLKNEKYNLNGKVNWHAVVIDQIGTTNMCILYDKVLKFLPKIEKTDYGDEVLNSVTSVDWDKVMDPHIWLPIISFAITALSGGVGGLIIAGLVESADIALWLKQGDPESAAIGTILLAIPGGMLINRIPAVKNFTSGALKTFLKKLSSKTPLSIAEKELAEQIARQQDELARLSRLYLSVNSKILNIIKRGGLGSMIVLLKLAKFKTSILKWTFRVGSVVYTFAQLYMKLTEKYSKLMEIPEYQEMIVQQDVQLTTEQKEQSVEIVDKEVSNSEEVLEIKTKEDAEEVLNTMEIDALQQFKDSLDKLSENLDQFFIVDTLNTQIVTDTSTVQK